MSRTLPATNPVRGGRPRRTFVAIGVFVLLAATVIAVLAPRQDEDTVYLDPDGSHRRGARALVQVLGARGVDVQRQERFDQVLQGGRDRTLLVVNPDLLGPTVLDRLPEVAEEVVLVAPGPVTVGDLGVPAVAAAGATRNGGAAPGCDDPAAANAGVVDLDGVMYRDLGGYGLNDVTLCFPAATPEGPQTAGTGMLMTWTRDGTRFTAVGSDQIFTNRSVAGPGRAALGVWLLGGRTDLTWWLVDPMDPALLDTDRRPDPMDLLPGWVGHAAWWLVAVAVLAMVWRGRRLGRLIGEPLPVLVHSAETATGRAALYRESRARDRAAALLRARTVHTLRRLLGLGTSASPADVVNATAGATGLPAAQITDVLTGPAPGTDQDLVHLVRRADALVAYLRKRTP